MTPRERMLTALNCGIPDEVPTFDWFDEPVIYGVAEMLGIDSPEHKAGMTRHGEEDEESLELFIKVISGLGMDGVWHSYSVEMESTAEGYGRDKYGKTYMFSDFGEPLITDAPPELVNGTSHRANVDPKGAGVWWSINKHNSTLRTMG
ncbi:MAG: hypothetical protein AAF633_16150 [Chloroflexota bacterium]